MTVTLFTGGSLPAGWTAVAPAGSSVDLPGNFLQLTIASGQTFNSLSGSINAPQGPLAWRAVSGAFDFAVGLAEEACNLPNQGLDLLGLTEAMNGIRFANFSGAQTTDYRSDIGWFVRDQPGGVNQLSTSGDTLMGGLYGGPGWLRLAWDGVSTWTCYASHTGRSGSWFQLDQFTASTIPTRFAIHATATPSGVDGRVQRINRVVDLLARGSDDATDEPSTVDRSTLHVTDFASGTLPAWLTTQTANGGSVNVTVDGAELTITDAQNRSQAWLLGPADLPADHGMLLAYQLTQSGYLNAFWIPALAVDVLTDIAGARTPDDKYGPGTSLLLEMPARIHAAQGQIVRTLRRSPIRTAETQSGSREFDGYTLMIEDAAAPVSTVDTPLTWMRIERVGSRLRARLWLDGDPEPTSWNYEVEDHIRVGDQIAVTLSQNDSVTGAGALAAVRLSEIELYELVLQSGLDLSTGIMTFTPVPLVPVPQPVVITLSPATLTFQAIPVVPLSGASVMLVPGVLDFQAVALTYQPGLVTMDLSPGILTFQSVAIGQTGEDVDLNVAIGQSRIGSMLVAQSRSNGMTVGKTREQRGN